MSHAIQHFVFLHHHSPISNSKDVKSPQFSSLSESEKVDRAVYALYKIKNLNPDFLNAQETELFSPKQPKILRHTLWHGSSFAMAGITGWHLYQSKLGLKTLGLVGAVYVTRHVVMGGVEKMFDVARMGPRKSLAKEYMELVGAEELHNIVSPNYSIKKIKHMVNPKIQIPNQVTLEDLPGR